MPWVITGSLPTWSLTDQQIINSIIYKLLENGAADANLTFLTTMFSSAETVNILNQRQAKFLRDTAAIAMRGTLVTLQGQSRYALPDDWIHTRRLTFQSAAPGSQIDSLSRTDAFALDLALDDWQQNQDTPAFYNDGSNLPTLTVEIIKAPSNPGTLGLTYIPQGATMTGAGVAITLPDELDSALIYGTLADILSSEGEGCDNDRASYCEQRYQLTIDLVNAILMGSPDGASQLLPQPRQQSQQGGQ